LSSTHRTFLVVLLAGAGALAGTPVLCADAELPAGWFKTGSKPAAYDMSLDTTIRQTDFEMVAPVAVAP
jgi:hypothetical protein